MREYRTGMATNDEVFNELDNREAKIAEARKALGPTATVEQMEEWIAAKYPAAESLNDKLFGGKK